MVDPRDTHPGGAADNAETGSLPPRSPVGAADASRRRFTKAGLAAPILMSLASQPVLAQGRECTASAFASANPSRPVDRDTCRGCSPGYWHLGRCWPRELDSLRTTAFYLAFGYDRAAYEGFSYPSDPGGAYPSKAQILDVLDKPLIDFFPSTGLGSNELAKFVRAALAALLNAYHDSVPFWDDADATHVRAVLASKFPTTPGISGGYATADKASLLADADAWATWWDEGTPECVLPGSGACPDD